MKQLIIDYLNELYPDAKCELDYSNDYELLINIILSAQTTDKKVNIVTKDLYKKYSSSSYLAKANVDDVSKILLPLGLSRVKANYIINCCKTIMDKYNGQIPNDINELIKLSGVGSKTAQVFLAVYYNAETFAVDTHVRRVSNRLGLVDTQDVSIIENRLKEYFPKEKWNKLHHQFVLFGRYFCTASKPNCSNCKLKNKCQHKN